MNERVLRLILILTMVVNGALAVASLRRTEALLERAIPKWEAGPQGRVAGDAPVAVRPGPVSHVYPTQTISAAWANELVDHVNELDKRCPRGP